MTRLIAVEEEIIDAVEALCPADATSACQPVAVQHMVEERARGRLRELFPAAAGAAGL